MILNNSLRKYRIKDIYITQNDYDTSIKVIVNDNKLYTYYTTCVNLSKIFKELEEKLQEDIENEYKETKYYQI